jgi:hypothetical protein
VREVLREALEDLVYHFGIDVEMDAQRLRQASEQ